MKGLKIGGLLEPKKPGYSAVFLALSSERRSGMGLDDLWELLVVCDDPAWSNLFAALAKAGVTFKAPAWWLDEHLRPWEGA